VGKGIRRQLLLDHREELALLEAHMIGQALPEPRKVVELDAAGLQPEDVAANQEVLIEHAVNGRLVHLSVHRPAGQQDVLLDSEVMLPVFAPELEKGG
jgi:hypothetical protein